LNNTCCSELGVERKQTLLIAAHALDARLLILAHFLLEEIRLATQRYILHEVEWILAVVEFLALQLDQETIGHVLNVLGHEARVHAYQVDGQGVREKLLLYFDGVAHYFIDALTRWLVHQVTIHEAGKVCVETFVARYQLVTER